uniref:Shugoshin_C domain-containing protein n=1 Tax=Macrostomum lignano TaxID=282301 RepID=A0A1I8GW29_9PLAT
TTSRSRALLTASAESCPTDKFQTPQAASKSLRRPGKGHGQGPQLYNRKTAANPRKVNYEHVKVSELYPGSLETVDEQQTTDGLSARQAPAGPQGAPDPAPIRQTQQPQKQQDSATNSTEQQQKQLVNNKPEDEKRKGHFAGTAEDGLMSTTATICRKLKAKRKINDSIFTDETFYSLEST